MGLGTAGRQQAAAAATLPPPQQQEVFLETAPSSSSNSRQGETAGPQLLLSTAAAAGPSSSSSSSRASTTAAVPSQQQPAAAVPLSELLAYEQAAVALFQRVKPSVVHITHMRATPHFYSLDIHMMAIGQGSGFIWDKAGHVVTNYHVSCS
jgi:S1-C subfamily serine protease